MPAVTVSSVNTGTDELTATAHGLLTGDRFRLRNVGGALPAATPSLAPVTDYFAIKTGANTIKVAVSSSNALAGTAVNITGAGTGTHLIEYGLPYCVPRIAAPLGQVFSADQNATWKSLVALYDLLTGQAESVWNGSVKLADALSIGGDCEVGGALTALGELDLKDNVVIEANKNIQLQGSGQIKHGTRTKIISPKMAGGYSVGFGASVFQAVAGSGAGPPPTSGVACSLDEYFIFGDRITEIRWKIEDSATGPTIYSFQMFEETISTLGNISLGTSNTSNGSGTQQVLTLSGLTATIRTDKFHSISASAVSGSDNVVLYPFEVDFDHP